MVVKVAVCVGAIVGIAAISGCSETVTHTEKIPFSKGVIDLEVSSVGGALGEERYKLTFDNGGKVQTFFRGSNFSEFHVGQRGSKIAIQMCRGSIDRAESIGVGHPETNFEVVRLDLDWNCKEKAREA